MANPYPVEPKWKRAAIRLNPFCLTNATGRVSVAVDASLFFNAKFEERTQETRLVNVTWEETGQLNDGCDETVDNMNFVS
ncbi:hypothetical protein F2P79_022242 [Pimephales promelas]|nr:hypothetical protein F2P79_022242 [Pimephales promelas]